MRRHMPLFAAVVLVAALTGPSAARATGSVLLPDLRQAPVGCGGGHRGDPARCSDWDVCVVADASAPNGDCGGSGEAVRLRFTTSADNVGDGPLLIYGSRPDTREPTMSARQAFQSSVDGRIPGSYAEAQNPIPARMYYEPAPSHTHWHLLDFEHFQLRTPNGQVVVADRKTGFCLGDRYRVRDHLANRPENLGGPAGELAEYLRQNRCGHHAPEALEVVEGISVGYGDDYLHTVDYQWLDLTRVPSGVYDVLNVVNGDRSLVEKSYDNNASSVAISLQWPGGATEPPERITSPPVVKLLRSCPGKDRCARQG
ncbi:lysyl oxidase family protein [Saccharothrix syringae]|uniref:Lysyl oxidase n=1 Tax=Saccharothrix syringae TaxID=103733 RepID=A0A5Q0GY13_SACSY|nr:lysyl oxidase family protein [Saccharothrix syringae]QFZ18242.1 lysyl oxidase [Saccharothrix syringae]